MTTRDITRGDLRTEIRVGVPHWVPGQHRAWRWAGDAGEDLAILRYVDTMGHLCLILLERQDGRWVPEFDCREGISGGTTTGWRPVTDPARYVLALSEAAHLALENAEPTPT